MHDLEATLKTKEPFDAQGIFSWLARRAATGMEVVTDSSYERTLQLPGGVSWFRASLRDGGAELEPAAPVIFLEAKLADAADAAELTFRVRKLFDLDADPSVINSALINAALATEELSQNVALKDAVLAAPGLRVPGAIDAHEMLIRAMIGQQVSVVAARKALSNLVEALGEKVSFANIDSAANPADAVDTGHMLVFPTMQAIAESADAVLRGPKRRIAAIAQVAQELHEGTLLLTNRDDSAALRARLLARKGIGPWTADYVRMRVLGDKDLFLEGDSAVRAGARKLGLVSEPKELATWAKQAAPWRSYPTAHLWNAN